MAEMLMAHVRLNALHRSRTHRCDAIPFRPAQVCLADGSSTIDPVGRTSLHTLQQAGNLGRRMEAYQHVQVRRDDPEFQQSATLLAHNDRQVLPQILRPNTIDARQAITRCPDNMNHETVMHAAQCAGRARTSPSSPRTPCRFSDTSRAVALATSSWPGISTTARPAG